MPPLSLHWYPKAAEARAALAALADLAGRKLDFDHLIAVIESHLTTTESATQVGLESPEQPTNANVRVRVWPCDFLTVTFAIYQQEAQCWILRCQPTSSEEDWLDLRR